MKNRIPLMVAIVLFLGGGIIYKYKQSKKKTVIYVDMIADLFHYGHINFLKQAKTHGDYLIVGICSDEVATKYKRKPVMTMEERVNSVKECKYVDEVVGNAPLIITKEWMEKYNIDYIVHGDDYTPELIEKYYGVPFRMGKYKSVPYTPTVSTSDLIARAKERTVEKNYQTTV